LANLPAAYRGSLFTTAFLFSQNNGEECIMDKIRYLSEITDVARLYPFEVGGLEAVTNRFPFMANTYCLGLINWSDPEDPVRRLIIPTMEEIDNGWGDMDASCESHYQVVPGLQHKYPDTAVMLVTDSCFGYCRYCFRKRLFTNYRETEVLKDISMAVKYIKNHREINNVLVSGGDPLMLSTASLRKVFTALREINHVDIIRVGTNAAAFNPFRIIDDPDLPAVIKQYSTADKRIYFMLHFSHSNEITQAAVKAVNILLESGAILCNQTPLLRGVNDNPRVLAELFKKLAGIGVVPYYVFQVRPTVGNRTFAMPLVEAYRIFEESQKYIAGTAKRARFVMSHSTGKIEIIGLDDSHIYLRYHRSPNPEENGALIVARRNDYGHWLEDFQIVSTGGLAQTAGSFLPYD
jgi:KamA family protein